MAIYFTGKPWLAGCPFDSQSNIILTVSILTGQAAILHILHFDAGRYIIQCTSGCTPMHLYYTSNMTTSQVVLKQKFFRLDALPVTQPTASSTDSIAVLNTRNKPLKENK